MIVRARLAAALALALCLAPFAHAQQDSTQQDHTQPDHTRQDQGLPASDPLYKTVAGLDTALFDAYNHCDLDKLGAMVDENLEFYHDQTGLAVGRKPFVDSIRTNICNKVQRVLVPGTLEVYPLNHYGAVEICVHRFTHPHDPSSIGEAKTVILWQLKDGAWQVARVISFDHHAAQN